VMKEMGKVDTIIRIDYEYGRDLVLPNRDSFPPLTAEPSLPPPGRSRST